jgi:glycosyltransferase involved in cell wall biosynthesis
MKNNIVFLGATDNYPLKFTATNSKNELVARGLLPHAEKITFINSPLGLNKGTHAGDLTGSKYGLEYHLFPKSRGLSLLKNIRSVYKIMKEKRSPGSRNVLLMEHNYYPFYLLFALFAKRLNYKVIVIITEWHIYFERMPLYKKIDYATFDYTFGYFTHAIFPISKLLEEKTAHFKKPMLKIPVLADFEFLKPVHYAPKDESSEYFMYCGTLGYFSVIQFIIKSYSIFVKRGHQEKLRMVLNGADDLMLEVKKLIAEEGLESFVIIEQRLPFDKLMEGYQHALALLIPLRPERQDKARFSHKIGEYLSSGRPIITGNVGEIEQYFEHKKNAFIASDYTVEAYADLFTLIATDKELANKVGLEGRKLGEASFNYSTYGQIITDFIDKL